MMKMDIYKGDDAVNNDVHVCVCLCEWDVDDTLLG